MIELQDDRLVFRFPEVHEQARMEIAFQRTLRLPDDGQSYPLPPGVGEFPLRHVDDWSERLPAAWGRHGGVMLPMYRAEALWLSFHAEYPCAVKIATGKINALTGEAWHDALCPRPQDYLVVPDQPWLDGFVVARGEVRQFVAMPLGAGYTAEEQLIGAAEHGGLQIAVSPMSAERYEAARAGHYAFAVDSSTTLCCAEDPPLAMGLAPGGRMQQEIFEDGHGDDAWQQSARSRCFVHLADSLSWVRVTGERPPTRPPNAQDYAAAGLPWFEWYDDERRALEAMPELARLRGIDEMHRQLTGQPLAEEPMSVPRTVTRSGPVRELGEALARIRHL